MKQNPTDSRARLCQELDFFAEKHPEQRGVADNMKQFISTTPDCFERSHSQGHITGSAWLVSPTGDKALLTLHRKLGRWLQPGGHADGDSNPLRAALREAEEESGIKGIVAISPEIFDIDIHQIPARPATGEPAHYHYDIRYLLQAPHEQFCVSEESDALAWWSQNDFISRASDVDAAVIRMAERYFQSPPDLLYWTK